MQCRYAVLAAMPKVGSPGVVEVVPEVVPFVVVVLVLVVGAGAVGAAAVGATAVGAAALLLFVLVGATTTVGGRLLAVDGEAGAAGIGNAAMGAPTDATDAADAVVVLVPRNDKVTGTAMAANTTSRAIAAITAHVVVHLVALRGAAFNDGVANGVEGDGGGGDDPLSLFDDNKVKSSASSSLLA